MARRGCFAKKAAQDDRVRASQRRRASGLTSNRLVHLGGGQKPSRHQPHFFACASEFGVSCFSSRTSSGKLSAINITAAVTKPTVTPSHQKELATAMPIAPVIHTAAAALCLSRRNHF